MEYGYFEQIKSWFFSYIRSFGPTSDLIKTNHQFKEEHSYEVAKISGLIASSLQLTEKEIKLAELIGLLHDTGRFPQFAKYQTFKDSQSENHATLGVKVLQDNLVLNSLPLEDQVLILAAIQNHNTFVLPSTNDERIQLFSKIIRDADKLDIYRFILESETNRLNGNQKKVIHLELEEKTSFSETMLIDILNNQCCLYSDLKSVHDFKLLQLSWVFDINYPYTFHLLKEKRYLPKLCSLLPKEENIQLLTDHVLNFVENKSKINLF